MHLALLVGSLALLFASDPPSPKAHPVPHQAAPTAQVAVPHQVAPTAQVAVPHQVAPTGTVAWAPVPVRVWATPKPGLDELSRLDSAMSREVLRQWSAQLTDALQSRPSPS